MVWVLWYQKISGQHKPNRLYVPWPPLQNTWGTTVQKLHPNSRRYSPPKMPGMYSILILLCSTIVYCVWLTQAWLSLILTTKMRNDALNLHNASQDLLLKEFQISLVQAICWIMLISLWLDYIVFSNLYIWVESCCLINNAYQLL